MISNFGSSFDPAIFVPIALVIAWLFRGWLRPFARILSIPAIVFKAIFSGQGGVFDGPVLVLTGFTPYTNPADPNDVVFELKGQRRQPIRFLRRLATLDVVSRLRITGQEITISRTTVRGVETFVAPLATITTINIKHRKAMWLVRLALLAFLSIPIYMIGFTVFQNVRLSGFRSVEDIPNVFSNIFFLLPVGVALVLGIVFGAFYLWSYSIVFRISTREMPDLYGLRFTRRFGKLVVKPDDLKQSAYAILNLVRNAQKR